MNEYYGDNNRWFVARVINGNDPQQAGRFQVRIFGVHSQEVEDKFLPWAETVMPTTEGGVSGVGRIPQLKNNALVFGIFLDGKASQNPMIIGSMSHIEQPSSSQVKAAAESGRVNLLDSRNIGKEGVIVSEQQRQMYENGSAEIRQLRVLVMDFLISNGLPIKSAAGVCGNLEIESNFDPKAVSAGSEDSRGIAQWNSGVGRWQRVEAYASDLNEDPYDLFLQLKFLIYDMKTGVPHDCWNHLSNEMNITNFDGDKDDTNSTFHFFHVFERADPANYSNNSGRSRPLAARAAYDEYKATLIASLSSNLSSGAR